MMPGDDATMRAMRFVKPGQLLQPVRLPRPKPGPGEVLIRVSACAVCRTDLHLIDGELPDAQRPVTPGHEIVGRVEQLGEGVEGLAPGMRVGVPWLGWTCGACRFCRSGQENLCAQARFTGYQIDGGYADHAVADARYALPLPDAYDDVHAAPLLCAGLIGWRALAMALATPGEVAALGLYGFGAAAHIVAQVARHQGRRVLAFTRPGDAAAQAFARRLGCAHAGDADESPPEPLDAAILFAPAGGLVPLALAAVRPGGSVVCAGIHMSDIPSFPYDLLWREKRLVSVANLTRADGIAFLDLAPRVPVATHVETLPLSLADRALARLRAGDVEGALVLVPDP